MRTLWDGPAPELERDAQRDTLLELGRALDVTVWRRTVGVFLTLDGKRRVRVGVPGEGDIGGILAPNGRAFWIEMKSRTGDQRDQQRAFERMVVDRGGVYIVSRSLEESLEKLAPYRRDPWRP